MVRKRENSIGIYLYKREPNQPEFDVKLSNKNYNLSFTKKWRKDLGNWGWPTVLTVDELFDPNLKNLDEHLRWKLNFEVNSKFYYIHYQKFFKTFQFFSLF